ncbi:4Fe-4S binding protein [Desulfoplanes formicivorans]|uniref:4Fe-4S binding protein n=1 Tax=Desulfoplanes formicivorans TaxID=1592317 RepID=UPI00085395D0|nr:4Fe-4S binding protein [Desulfoplanes formicivorans]
MRISFSCVRRSVQVVFALFCLFTGWRFYRYSLWLTGASTVAAVRPPSVEAFLPISALLGFKSFLVTGVFDSIHPAGLVILLAAVGSALLLRRAFCGYICPIGLFSDGLFRLGEGFLPRPSIPRPLEHPGEP